MKFTFSCFLIFLIVISGSSQSVSLSKTAQVSVITIGPGTSLNDAFGHNAFRIRDRSLGLDVVYGYGEYDFDAPNFYLKFARGKLNYLISRNNFSDFYNYYVYSNRTVKEQLLNFKPEEKQELFNFLETNYKPENRRYLYDFFYDNCATKIRDVTLKVADRQIYFSPPIDFEPKTFRQLIHDHVGLNTWGSFGIDIALGSVIDLKATSYEHMFLPQYIHTFFEHSKFENSENLVKGSETLYENKNEENAFLNFIYSPMVVVTVVAFLMLFFTYRDYKNKTRNRVLDITLFGVTGLIGIVILLLWFATDHTATAQNYNLLWAFPLNVFLMFQVSKGQVKKWVKNYLKFLIIMLCLMTLHWFIRVQVFSIALIPLMIAMVIRYLYLVKFLKSR